MRDCFFSSRLIGEDAAGNGIFDGHDTAIALFYRPRSANSLELAQQITSVSLAIEMQAATGGNCLQNPVSILLRMH